MEWFLYERELRHEGVTSDVDLLSSNKLFQLHLFTDPKTETTTVNITVI